MFCHSYHPLPSKCKAKCENCNWTSHQTGIQDILEHFVLDILLSYGTSTHQSKPYLHHEYKGCLWKALKNVWRILLIVVINYVRWYAIWYYWQLVMKHHGHWWRMIMNNIDDKWIWKNVDSKNGRICAWEAIWAYNSKTDKFNPYHSTLGLHDKFCISNQNFEEKLTNTCREKTMQIFLFPSHVATLIWKWNYNNGNTNGIRGGNHFNCR